VKYTGRSDTVVIPAEFHGIPAVEIGEKAFVDNKILKSVTIPDSITTIAKDAFDGCTGLTSITFAETNELYSSDDGVLFNKDKTTLIRCPVGKSGSYTIPSSVTSVAYYAFEGCAVLTNVTIPDSVTSIGEDAFDGCVGLTSITIPASIIRIGEDGDKAEDAFDGCTGLTGITVAEANEVYSSDDGVLFNKDKTSLLLCPEGKSGSYTIPSSVTDIVDYAFEDCVKLTSVTMDSVTSIGETAFANCTGLTSIVIPASVKSITGGARGGYIYGAFIGCTGLTSVTISEGITSIGAGAFADCTGLTSITIPDSVTYIGGNAFARCTGLTSVTISPVEGREWDFRSEDGTESDLGVFADCSRLSNAAKEALKSAGYTGAF
jgi:hypothetical protein